MEHYKKLARYWRDSLVDKQFSKGKYKSSDLEKNFSLNDKNLFFITNNKNLLQELSSVENDNRVEIAYAPFSFRKIVKHAKEEKDYRPEIFFPIIFKVELSENGFIYPTDRPVIPRDLLLPLDKEDFFIGDVDDYDLFVTVNEAPTFEFSASSEWEKYYSEIIESQYRKGLFDCLLKESLIDAEQAKEDYKLVIKSLSKKETTKGKFNTIRTKYNDEWSKSIESKLTEDIAFNKAIELYITKWNSYFECIDQILDKVIKSKELLNGYEKSNAAYFIKGELDISSKITAVYEDIYTRDQKPNLSLFHNYSKVEQESEIPVVDSKKFFSRRLGHNNDIYPLADAQRTAVSTLIASKQGEIIPVNGPPGTGKTTMLLSVVSCLWVENAINESNPPIIIANSTNNQAVTNIIDAFAKDFSKGEGVFAGRWIEELKSFGSYFVSNMRGAAAKKKGYLTEDVVKEMETQDFYARSKASYLEKAQKAFNNKNITIEGSIRLLHNLLLEKRNLLIEIERMDRDYHILGKDLGDILNIDYSNKEIIEELEKTLIENKKEIELIENKWEAHLASENIFLSLFSFFPFVKKKRNLKAKVFAKENNFEKHFQIGNLDVDSFLIDIKDKKTNNAINIKKQNLFKITSTNYNNLLKVLGDDLHPDSEFIEIDKKADTKIRFEMFLIASHYWEGQWLLDMENLIDNEHLNKVSWRYKNIIENNWKRRMKITPCAVMTSYMLANYFSFTRKIHDDQNKSDYLYDFIDLLIVDEAGQVSPEVAGAGFSLAKKALVIGDTLQIPPISNLSKSIDIGNLHKADLISTNQSLEKIDENYKQLQAKGIASDGGSVMKIAQNRSKYFPEKKLERGLYLYEHRRCYDNIIKFCNELCYKGVLKPMRGIAKGETMLPSMGYLNIEGKCTNSLGSKENDLEAKIIAGWIINNYKNLREEYNGKEIKDIVAVVTPFREQSRKIAEHLKKAKDERMKKELSQITVGTVHSLQGAEREVVLFSPTYSRHNKGSFIDNDKSMLNVAVSRAKDSFLVFGDMSLFDRQSVSPTGILAKYLLEDENNELSYIHQYTELFKRNDLVTKKYPLKILTNYEEHDDFLNEIFSEATQRILIISPWLIYSTIAKSGYDKLLSQKNLKITIYTDKKFNTHTQNKIDKRKEDDFQQTLNKLNKLGIEVKVMNNIHSKIVIKDNDCMCIGSFNWFSAQRGGKYANTEHSLVYQGENVKEEIENILKQLN